MPFECEDSRRGGKPADFRALSSISPNFKNFIRELSIRHPVTSESASLPSCCAEVIMQTEIEDE